MFAFGVGGAQCLGHGHDARHVVSAAATISFLAATEHDWFEGDTLAHDQSAHTLGTTELVRADGQGVDEGPQRSQIDPARRLNGIGVQHGVRGESTNDLGHRLHVGDHSGLVVHGHHRHATDRFIERGAQRW